MILSGKYKLIKKNCTNLSYKSNKPQFQVHQNFSCATPNYYKTSRQKLYHSKTPIRSKVSKFKLVKSAENSSKSTTNEPKSLYKIDNRSRGKLKRNKLRSGVLLRRNFQYKLSRILVDQKLKRYPFKTTTPSCLTQKSNASQQNPYSLDHRSYKFIKTKSSNTESKFKLNKIIINNLVASGLVQRSIMTINRKNSKIKTSLKNSSDEKYCKFYNLFGKCSRGDSCKYRHDSNRIAVCAGFLNGTCNVDSCPYSHKANPEKVPLCLFFTLGCCNRENCPYLHVFHGKDAKFCEDFTKGYCKNGSKCDKAHLKICPDFVKMKSCPRGNLCPLMHKKVRNIRNLDLRIKPPNPTEGNQQSYTEKSDQSFISLKSYSTSNSAII